MSVEGSDERFFPQNAGTFAAGLAWSITSTIAADVPRGIGPSGGALEKFDRRYYKLDSWMGPIGLPDDPFKAVADADGSFLTERGKKSLRQGIYARALPVPYQNSQPFGRQNRAGGPTDVQPSRSISIAQKRQGSVAIEKLFLSAPLDWSAAGMGAGLKGRDSMPRPTQYRLTSSLISWLEHVLPHHSLNQFERLSALSKASLKIS
jgi:hypothetical protein